MARDLLPDRNATGSLLSISVSGRGNLVADVCLEKISSLSAIVMLCLLPPVSTVLPGMMTELPTWDLTAIQAALSLLLLYCHRDNLRRLREGSEGVLRSPLHPHLPREQNEL